MAQQHINTRLYAEKLAAIGYVCLTFDLRGMGESEGDIALLSRSNYLDDCLVAYDKLLELRNVTSISVVGSSFGSYMACLVAGRRPVNRLALRAPANYANEGFDEKQLTKSDRLDAEGLTAQQPPVRTYALDALGKFAGKVLIVQSGKDEIIHPATVQSFEDAVTDKSQLTFRAMKTAPHSISRSKQLQEEYSGILLSWFS